MPAATFPTLALVWVVLGPGPAREPFPAHRVLGDVDHVSSSDLAN
jgi:hypothetical protein